MPDINDILAPYDYDFPERLIAVSPADPRDSARLLFYNRKTGDAELSFFKNIVDFLPPRSVIVMNRTKVVPARFSVRKKSGGFAKLLYVGSDNGSIKVMSDRKLDVGSEVIGNNDTHFTVERQEEKYFFLTLPDPLSGNIGKFHAFLFENGETPLPPYIKKPALDEPELRREYQSVFARDEGSVAAPTASLHFTEDLLNKIKSAGHEICFVTLHVGLGTFAPLTEENILSGALHKEWYEIPKETVEVVDRAKKEGRPIIAVGTTSTRTLESAADEDGTIARPSGFTRLFIREGYRFKTVSGIITNFHVPKSSLLMLVSAFAGRESVMRLYEKAIAENFRLFSFGDGMFII